MYAICRCWDTLQGGDLLNLCLHPILEVFTKKSPYLVIINVVDLLELKHGEALTQERLWGPIPLFERGLGKALNKESKLVGYLGLWDIKPFVALLCF